MDSKIRLPFKESLQLVLGRAGLYERIKASWIYDAYWRVADKRIIEDRQREVAFYRNILEGFQGGELIFDLGANLGYKTDIFLRMGANVVAAEPDEFCQSVLRKKFTKYRMKKRPITVIGKAVSEQCSIQKMWIDAPGSAMNTLSQKWADALRGDDKRFGQRLNFGQWKEVETITIEQLIVEHGLPFFVKIDVEGFELNVLRGMRRPVPYLSFEANLPEFRPEGLQCLEVLAQLAPDGSFNYSADCRRGLVLERWLGPKEFSAVFETCPEPSIEVFWKTHQSER
jgi:FkbM family methyltransferase